MAEIGVVCEYKLGIVVVERENDDGDDDDDADGDDVQNIVRAHRMDVHLQCGDEILDE